MSHKKSKKMDKKIDNSLLTKFMLQEMKLRKLNKKEFGKLIGVSHSTVGRIINDRDEPSLDTLIKLSNGTDADIRMIISLVAPQQVKDSRPESLLLAERIDRLSEETQKLIDDLIINTLLRQERGNKDGSKITVIQK